MIELLSASENLPFAVALGLMLLIGLFEGVGLLLGATLSGLIDHALPDFDFDLDADTHLDTELGTDVAHSLPGGLTGVMGWLRLGKVPLLAWVAIFLTGFGIAGLSVQTMAASMIGRFLPALIAAIPAVLITLPFTRGVAGVMARVMPKDETSAVAEESFIGRIAVVTLGVARAGQPAQAKLKDQHGQTHYVMVLPDNEGVELPTGTAVLLVRRQGATFLAIKNPEPSLVE